ncbi:hypothetical protein THAOC_15769, partial [Thalassiosira oceanica]
RAGGRSSGATTPGACRSWSATSCASRAGPTSGPTARRTCPRRATSRWVCGRTRGVASSPSGPRPGTSRRPVEAPVRVQRHVQHQHERVEGEAVVHRRGERGGVAREDGHGGVRTDEQLVRRPEREEKRPDDDRGVHEGALDHSTFPRGMSFLRPPSSIEEETTKMENGITLASTLLL